MAAASLLLTVAANKLYARFEHVFRKRNVDIRLPFGVTMINVLLMLFSSVCSVVFQLITCVDIKRPSEDTVTVVFIDGTKTCEGARYRGLIAAAALLSLVPLVFFAGLRFEKISVESRAILCSAYADSRYYWAAITLFFRFIVTVVSATIPQVPSVAALVQCICSVCMLMLVVTLRPFKDERTYCMDVFATCASSFSFCCNVLRGRRNRWVFLLPPTTAFFTMSFPTHPPPALSYGESPTHCPPSARLCVPMLFVC